jgi:hypothetical protein
MPPTTTRPLLDDRALNRALLDRQMLLARSDRRVDDAVRFIYGLQSQAPWSAYHALWARLAAFDPDELGTMLCERTAVRLVVMRGTVHLVDADDARTLRHLHAGFLARGLRASAWATELDGVDPEEVARRAREELEDAPLPFRDLGRRLAERWPDRDPATLAQAARAHLPLVQVPPRAVWGRTGQVTVAVLDRWLGRPLDTTATLDEMVLRYLAAYGPASVMDVQAWSGLTRLREVTDRLGDRVVRFRNGAGRELLDLPDASRPDPDVAAPVRFLPDFDNVLLSHADRGRIVDDDVRAWLRRPNGQPPGTVLVDGRVAGSWSLAEAKGAATLAITPYRSLPGRAADEVLTEAAALLVFAAPGKEHDVAIARPAI